MSVTYLIVQDHWPNSNDHALGRATTFSIRARRRSAFRESSFANPQGLVRFVAEQGSDAKVRPDMKVVFVREFTSAKARLEGTRTILRTLASIALKKAA